ncbi:MAG: hypothetical protein U0795_17105 [Pirellulales bacterium]
MSRWIGLEQDTQQLRVLVGRTRRDGYVVERLLSFPALGVSDDPAVWWSTVGPQLEQAGVVRTDCQLAVGRQAVELRRLTLPGVSDDELPDMVKLVAMTEFSAINDQWPLDYVAVPAGRDATERVVMAAAMRPAVLETWRQVANLSGWKAQRMVFGPAAAARWIYRQSVSDGTAVDVSGGSLRQLMILPMRDAWTLIVADCGTPLLIRWVMRTGHQSDAEQLTAELKRTRAAAFSQLEGLQVDEVVLLSGADEGRQLARDIVLEDSAPLRVVDPVAGVLDEGASVEGVQVGEYSSLVAMLADEAAEVAPPLDFLAPHRRPIPPDRRRLYSLLAMTAAVLVLGAMMLVWLKLGQLDTEIANTQAQTKKLTQELSQAKATQKQLDEWQKWESERVQWLEEAARMSAALPSSEAVKLKQVRGFVSTQGGGTLVVEGMATDPGAIAGMDSSLIDAQHRVEGRGAQIDETDPKYRWKFEQSVVVLPKEGLAPAVEPSPRGKAATPARGRSAAAELDDVDGAP